MSRLFAFNVSKSRHAKRVLDGISLTLHDGQRVALTGENGSGKTTFLDILAGVLPLDPEEGSFHLANGSTLGYVRQRIDHEADHVFFDETLFLLEQRLRALEAKMAAGDHSKDILDAYDHAMREMDASDAYALRHKIEITFRELGLNETIWTRSLATLSGGERMRIELATCLVREPDILLIDEPTNHLDLSGIQWLEQWLQRYKGTCLFVSHDRAFMDAVATDVALLSGHHLEVIHGNYTRVREILAEREAALATKIRQQEREVKREFQVAQTMLSHRNIPQYHNRTRRAEKMQAELSSLKDRARRKDKTLGLRLISQGIEGDPDKIVMIVDKLSAGFASPLFEDFSADIKNGERIAVLGANGCGKSTLFSLLSGAAKPTSGRVRKDVGIRIGSLQQHISFQDENMTVYEAVRRFAGAASEAQIRSRLAQYGFDDTDRQKRLGVLSGGEAARVALLELLYEQPNFLFLDEPTNHLDIYTRELLEHELADYPGTILFISHDRYFLDAIAEHIWGFIGTTIVRFDSYEDWLRAASDDHINEPATERSHKAVSPVNDNRQAQRQASAKRRQELADLEKRIDELEAAITEVENSITATSGPSVYEHYAALTLALEHASDRYLALMEE